MRTFYGPFPLRGSLPALPTPFRDGALDLEALAAAVDRHARSGSAGVIVAGTTGEAPTLDGAERLALFRTAVEAAGERLAVVAGVGTNDTRSTVRLAAEAAALGVHGLLVVTPYYNRPQQRGLLAHFGAAAEAAPRTPVVLYNVPGRTGCDLLPETARALARRHPNVVAIKQAARDLERVERLGEAPELDLLCGEDALLREFLRRGAVGAINVVGNLLPRELATYVHLGTADADAPRVVELEARLAPLCQALFLEPNPAPLKAALARVIGDREELRLPLVPVAEETRARLVRDLTALGLGLGEAAGAGIRVGEPLRATPPGAVRPASA